MLLKSLTSFNYLSTLVCKVLEPWLPQSACKPQP